MIHRALTYSARQSVEDAKMQTPIWPSCRARAGVFTLDGMCGKDSMRWRRSMLHVARSLLEARLPIDNDDEDL